MGQMDVDSTSNRGPIRLAFSNIEIVITEVQSNTLIKLWEADFLSRMNSVLQFSWRVQKIFFNGLWAGTQPHAI